MRWMRKRETSSQSPVGADPQIISWGQALRDGGTVSGDAKLSRGFSTEFHSPRSVQDRWRPGSSDHTTPDDVFSPTQHPPLRTASPEATLLCEDERSPRRCGPAEVAA
jgi:hypothetical protein